MTRLPLRLVRRYLSRHLIRSALTILSIAVAVFLLCVLRSLVVALDAGVNASSNARFYVQSAVSLFVQLPYSYQAKIDALPGVKRTCQFTWFGGIYQEPENFFGQFGVQPEAFLELYPEAVIEQGSADDFVRERQACIVGYRLAERFGWQIGDSIPLEGTIYPRVDGQPWTFKLAAIYRSTNASVDDNTMYFHHPYLEESIDQGAAEGPDAVGLYVVAPMPGEDPIHVMGEIDALFENGPQRVQSTSEDEFQRQFVSMLGNIPFFLSAIGTAVFAAILLAVLNAMLMSAREQTHDVGILKALGFTNGAVFWTMLAQALLICAIGGGLGVALAVVSSSPMKAFLGTQFPGYEVTPHTTALAAASAVFLGVVSGALPAWKASRLRCVESLRAEG